MKTVNTRLSFVVLVPHIESVRVMDEYRSRLFARGFAEAYSFPVAAPLAVVSSPFSAEELKETARILRRASLQNEGRISSATSAQARWPSLNEAPALFEESSGFFGPLLDLPFEDEIARANDKVLYRFPKPVLCASLLASGQPEQAEIPAPPALSFRPAMTANLSIRPLETGKKTFSYEWKLSAPVWLPNIRHFRKGNE